MGHTEGPWEANSRAIEQIELPHRKQTSVICYMEDVQTDEWLANARLIAAAPDLLDVLTRLTEKVTRANSLRHSGGRISSEDWSEFYALQNEARATIAKAEGK